MHSLTDFFARRSFLAVATVAILMALVALDVAELGAIHILHNRQAEVLVRQEKIQKIVAQSQKTAAYRKMTGELIRLSIALDHIFPAEGDVFHQAIGLRNAIYRSVSLKKNPADFDFAAFGSSFSASLRDKRVGQICGGLTILYMAALEARGIPARYVGMFSSEDDARPPFETHASVEFFANGRWIASDPTFNVMYAYAGRFLSYAELWDILRAGKHYVVVSNGFPLKEGRRLEQYPISQDALLKFLVIDPADVYDRESDRLQSYPAVRRPRSWNGMIALSGSKVRVGHNSHPDNEHALYRFLESGPLR